MEVAGCLGNIFLLKKEGEGEEMRRKKVIFVAQKGIYVGFCIHKVIG